MDECAHGGQRLADVRAFESDEFWKTIRTKRNKYAVCETYMSGDVIMTSI
jgi:hypothetical protein